MRSITIEELKDNDYKMIEELASCGFPPEEVADVIEVDQDVLVKAFNDKTSRLYKAYRKGILLSEYTLRQRIFKDANNGSSPAQSLAKKILDDCFYKISNK